MSDQPVTNQPNPEPVKVDPTASMPEKTGEKTYTQAELETIIKERVTRLQTQAEKKAQDAAEKAAAEQAAKNGEWEKLAKQRETELANLQTQLRQKELSDLRRTIAEKVGLPIALASRLQGETEAEIETDAKSLLETLPKVPKPNPGPVANPGMNVEPQETSVQQRLTRIHGGGAGAFDFKENS